MTEKQKRALSTLNAGWPKLREAVQSRRDTTIRTSTRDCPTKHVSFGGFILRISPPDRQGNQEFMFVLERGHDCFLSYFDELTVKELNTIESLL